LKHTIEDCLEIVAGLRDVPDPIIIKKEDATIMFSIAKQVLRGLGLSDKQHALMKTKLLNYSDQLLANNIIVEETFNNLRYPLRSIDRAKYIKLVTKDDIFTEPKSERWKEQLSNLPWVKVRFPFSKKLIVRLQQIPMSASTYVHPKGSHTHFFALTENVVYEVIEAFKDNHFEIDQEIFDIYDEIVTWKRKDYVPGVFNGEVKNLPQNVIDEITNRLGKPTANNIHLYYDKRFEYGIVDIDEPINVNGQLVTDIATRESLYKYINSKETPLQEVFKALNELDSYPINILVDDESAFDILTQTHQLVRNYIPNEQITVLYRKDSHSDKNGYNQYIKDNNLNTPVDKDTKIVYTLKSKVNKPLAKSDCLPNTALSFSTERHSISGDISKDVTLYIEYSDKEPIWRDWRMNP
jgi:hypothetical protein